MGAARTTVHAVLTRSRASSRQETQPIEEFSSGELGSNQTINHNTSTMLSLQVKPDAGLDQWGNGDYTIYNTGTFK